MLEVKALRGGYGSRPVLHDIDFDVKPGEVVALLGANGAGKTTTLRTISGLLPPQGGEIRIGTKRINGLSPHRVIDHGIALVPEGRMIFPEMSVLDHLVLGATRARLSRAALAARLDEMYALIPLLSERRDQLAGTLSGGQQQLLAIGRGLMTGATTLMLDEPTLGLSPIASEELGDQIRTLAARGLAILLVEQRVDLALQLANRAFVIENGRTVISGGARDLAADARIREAYLAI